MTFWDGIFFGFFFGVAFMILACVFAGSAMRRGGS